MRIVNGMEQSGSKPMGMEKMTLGELPPMGPDPARTGLVADRKTDADTCGLYQKKKRDDVVKRLCVIGKVAIQPSFADEFHQFNRLRVLVCR